VDKYDIIACENLSVNSTMKNHNLAKAIQDASWSEFWNKVEWKAKQNGTLAIAVDPEYSTQESRLPCRDCSYREISYLHVAVLQRDIKAA